MHLSHELQHLAADLDRTFAAEDREIVREATREREMDEARRTFGLPPTKKPACDIKTYGFGGAVTSPR